MNDREALSWRIWGKRPRGRPSHFSMRLAERIYALARQGITDAQIAWLMDIGEATLHRWKLGSMTFKWELQKAKAEADEQVERSLLMLCRGMTLTEKTTERVKIDYENGVVTKEVVTEREIPPDLGAVLNWLVNRRSDRWGKNPRPAAQNPFRYFDPYDTSPNDDPQAKLIAEAITAVLNGLEVSKVRV